MKVIIAGGRDFTNTTWSFDELDKLLVHKKKVTILCGDAYGADKVGEEYANTRKLKLKHYPADWDKYGLSAGYLRNREMASVGHMLIAFWDGKSKGTFHMINLAKEMKLKVKVIRYERRSNEI